MNPPVDTSAFPTGAPDVSYDEPEDVAGFAAMQAAARRYVESFRSSPPIERLTLAFGITPIIGLYLAHFTTPITRGELAGEQELWAVVGDLPSMCFETDVTPTPALALELYCVIGQDWADRVLTGEDLSESYPIPVAPTRDHAEMLLSRIEFIREKLIPLA